jgi:hypothetical protein
MQAAARKVLEAERDDNGASNIWYHAASILVSPWLAMPAPAVSEDNG